MAACSSSKDSGYKEGTVKLSTFKAWGYGNTFGFVPNGDKVDYIWCKTCTKHKDEIATQISGKGKVKDDQLRFTKEVRFIKKSNVERHLRGNCHKLALKIETTLKQKRNSSDGPGSPEIPNKQPRIDDIMKKSSHTHYEKMFRIAHNLAEGMMPFSKFRVLVKCVRENNVHLISGKDDHRAAEEYVRYIADSIRERLAVILSSANAYSILSDGSEARKTGMEKELVFVRLIKGGIPVYYCIALQDCDEYGGVDSVGLKSAIDSVFDKNLQTDNEGQNEKLRRKFETNLVSATADGASVNFGRYNGLLTQLKESRLWLINIHCVAHRAELSLKDYLLSIPEFKKLDETMIGLFHLFKKSGKLKRSIKKESKIQNVDAYVLPKVTGTRFVGHRLNAVKVLLHNWAVYMITFRKEIDERSPADKVRSKLIGYMKVLDDFKIRCAAFLFKKILSICSHLQYQFEEGKVLAFEIPEKIDKLIDDLQELIDEYTAETNDDEGDGDIVSKQPRTDLEEYGDCILRKDPNFGANMMYQKIPKAGHLRKKLSAREYTEITFGMVKFVAAAKSKVQSIARNDIPGLMNAYRARFKSFEGPIFRSMLWLHPANWDLSNPQYGLSDLKTLAKHFEIPLKALDFSIENIENEWKSFKRMCTRNYANIKSAVAFWQRILTYRRDEYSNVCALAEICLVIGASNSTVERGFSKLTTLLTDKRLSMCHRSMENCLLIAANASSFNEAEKEEIIKAATKKYLNKRRRKANFVKKVPLVTEEDSDDEVSIAEVTVAAFADNSDINESDDDGMERDDTVLDDISESDNSDFEEDEEEEINMEEEEEEIDDAE